MTILHRLRRGISTTSAEETEAVGAQLGASLPDNTALALHGDLGAGKTTLVRGLARALGITTAVTSPTYNIYTLYKGKRQLLHMDAYRIKGRSALDSLSIEEFLDPPFIVAVEWPDNIQEFFAEYSTYHLDMDIDPEHKHHIKLRG